MPGRSEFLDCIRDLPPDEQKRLCKERDRDDDDPVSGFMGVVIVLAAIFGIIHYFQ